MNTNVLKTVLTMSLLIGCSVSKDRPDQKVAGAFLNSKSRTVCAPANEKSEVITIDPGWICTWRTKPSGIPLFIWVNNKSEPILFTFGQKPQIYEEIQSIRFGSVGKKPTEVKIVLYPPGVQPNIDVESE